MNSNLPPRPTGSLFVGRADVQDSSLRFGELADTLFYWIGLLHKNLIDNAIEQVFFLSREGQLLKRMFDLYCNRVGVRVQSHYLEVSRRSTLLPSLASLSEEKFETLFRQYRSMSLLEFLSSIGLEAYCAELSESLGLTAREATQRVDDFPGSELFANLKALPGFNEVYDLERLSRRAAFMRYLSSLTEDEIPANLVVVDVGWKGTIQDNLYALLCTESSSPVKSVTGYYIGLVAEGAVGPNNLKKGLLFSVVDSPTPRFHVFNENRALFEILLAADHGSVASYEVDANGKARAIHGSFDEKDMLEQLVFPVQRDIFERYNQILNAMAQGDNRRVSSLDEVARTHARLVFSPSRSEVDWFSSVFHVENYGVFERSFFTGVHNAPSLPDRLRFMLAVFRRSGRGALGFWPWKKLDERVGRPVANLYGLIRYFQK